MVLLTLVGVKGYRVGPYDSARMWVHRENVGQFDRDVVAIPDTLIEEFDADLPTLMR